MIEMMKDLLNIKIRMRNAINLFLAFLFFITISVPAWSTHIVGGDLTYKCLGNNQYEVTLMVYRDCIHGSEEAQYDDPASIAIFDASNNLQVHLGDLGQILINFKADDTLSLSSDCIMNEEDGICVQQTIYRKVVELPFVEGGYTLAYQRCCRNVTLTNIVEPLETGATFITHISENALRECNNAAVFREWPPIFVCLNQDLDYNHSAMDEDGDSLVYKLCTPFMGATRQAPYPQPASSPPYDPVMWHNPYNLDNLLGGDALSIDSRTGLITGTPNTIGQFLVGVCVEEYRNGQLIGTTRRDFEYNVVDCSELVLTGFDVDTSTVCADVVEVVVTDNSIGVVDGTTYTYIVTSDNGFDAEFTGPNVTFEVNGRQNLRILQRVMVSDSCTTSKSRTMLIDVEDTGINGDDTITVCSGSSVALNPGYSDRYEYEWSPTTNLEYADGPNPIASPTETTTYYVTVTDPVVGCSIVESVTVVIIPRDGVIADFDVSKECKSRTINFINKSSGSDNFIWTFGDPTNPGFTSNERDPVYTYPYSGTFDAVLTIPGDECNTLKTKRLPVAGEDFEDFDTTIASCGPSLIDLDHGMNPDYLYQWEANSHFSDLTEGIPEVYLKEDATFHVTVTDPLNTECVISGVVRVTIGDQLVVDLGDSLFTCEPAMLELNPNGDPSLIYMWTPTRPLDDPTSYNPTANIIEDVRFIAKVTDPNDPDCMVRIPLMVRLGINDGGFEDGDSLTICDSSTFFLNPGANPDLVYEWMPTSGLSDPTHPNPIASPSEDVTYTVTVSDSSGTCSLTKSIHISVVDSDVLLNFDKSKECNSLTVMFINQSRGATTYEWTFGDPNQPNETSNEENPTFTYTEAGTYDVELRSYDDPNCIAISAMRITLTGDDFVDFSDTIDTCDPRRIPLNPNRNVNYVYAWQADPAIEDTTAANPIVSLTEDRTFYVTITDPLNDTCTVEGTVTVLTDDRLIKSLRDSILACMTGEVALNPDGYPHATYTWEPADLLDDPTAPNPIATISENTVFRVTIVDPNKEGCSVEAEVKVVFDEYVKLITTDPISGLCAGDTVTLNAKGDLVDSLTWCDPNGTPLGTTEEITFTPEVSGVYRLKATVGECEYEDTISIQLREIGFMFDPDLPVCSMDPVTITLVNNSGIEIDSVMWSGPNITLGDDNESVVVRPEVTSTYTAMVVFADGCVVTDSTTVTVSDGDRFVTSADPDSIFFGETSTVSVTLEDGATYEWRPNDLVQTPNSNSTVVVPTETTTFFVDIVDANGCMFTKEQEVVVIVVQCEPPHIFLPNAFSPNGDGINDVLFLRGQYIESMELIIYDRWGEEVFKTRNQSIGWDGTFKGNLLPPDVYAYNLMVTCIGGDQHLEKGNVTILH